MASKTRIPARTNVRASRTFQAPLGDRNAMIQARGSFGKGGASTISWPRAASGALEEVQPGLRS